MRGRQERLRKRLLAVGKAVGKHFVAGAKRFEGRWGRTEAVGRADGHPQRAGSVN